MSLRALLALACLSITCSRDAAQDPDRAELRATAHEMAAAGQTAKAEALLTTLIRTDPDDAESWVAYGRFLHARGYYRMANDSCQRAAGLDPQLREASACRALALAKMGDYPEAERLFGPLIASPPDGMASDLSIGYIEMLYDSNRLEQALSHAEALARREAGTGMAHYWHARVLFRLGRTREAAAAAARAQSALPDYLPLQQLRHRIGIQGVRVAPPSAATPGSAMSPIAFDDVTAASQVEFTLRNGATGSFHLPELMPGGVAALDVDDDDCLDLFFTNGATSPALVKSGAEYHNRLFRNRCDGTFVDITERAGAAGIGYSMATAAADYDNDGDTDLFVAGVNHNQLLRNRGDGTFEDVTARAGLTGRHPTLGKLWSMAAGWFDADNDGRLDLVVANYVAWDPAREKPCGQGSLRAYCHPDAYGTSPNQLFRNTGDGTFADVSAASGLGATQGKAMGLAFADFNGDGRLDLFVTNDSMRNFLYENRGGMKFVEVGLEHGVAYGESGRPVAGMGTDFRDVDNDGLPDIVLSAMINDTYLFLRNLGGPGYAFDDVTNMSGIARVTRQLTGWGLGFFDFDNDGWKDLFVANSHFPQLSRYLGTPSPLRNILLRNAGGARFEDVSGSAGPAFQEARYFRGAAFGDFDRDGRVDIAVSAMNAGAMLLRNTTPGDAHWVAFRLRGIRTNRDGLGATVTITLAGDRVLTNHATTSVGYASSSERLVRFGLGAAERIAAAVVRWPSGRVQELGAVPVDRIVTVTEPR